MNWLKKPGNIILILIIGGGLLLCFLTILGPVLVSDYSSLIYSPSQQEYLSYNSARVISQEPAAWNTIAQPEVGEELGDAAAVIAPAMFTYWENHVDATLDARTEVESGVSVTVYDLDFTSEYRIRAPDIPVTVELVFPFPSNLDTLHDVQLLLDGEEPPGVEYSTQQIRWLAEMQPNEEYAVTVEYKAEGVNRFVYGLYKDRRMNVLDVNIEVTGLRGTTLETDALPYTDKDFTISSDTFTWEYNNLVGNQDISLELPQRLSFAQRVAELQDDFRLLTVLAPFWVVLFMTGLWGWTWLQDRNLPFEVYALMGFALILFYPLLIFLSSLMPLILSSILTFVIISAVEVLFLFFSRKWSDLIPRVLWLLLIVLGLLSIGMLTPLRGLMVSVALLTLVLTFMIVVGGRRVSIREKFAAPEQELADVGETPVIEEDLAAVPDEAPSSETEAHQHCPSCGELVADDFKFCATCGYDLKSVITCHNCGYTQAVAPDVEQFYCLNCGTLLIDVSDGD